MPVNLTIYALIKALQYNSQVAEHGQCSAMLNRKDKCINEQQSYQEVDEVDNQVA